MAKGKIRKAALEKLYRRYNRRQYVHPDPLEFLYRYPAARDREIVALLAASLAYGRVSQILRSVQAVLDRLGKSPHDFVKHTSRKELAATFAGFRHRFTSAAGIVSLLEGTRRALSKYGSLNECFLRGFHSPDATVLPALEKFVAELGCRDRFLLPVPGNGSACKRLNLFLRWMVRKDAVDPGGWHGVPKSKLIVPLDTHMAQIGRTWRLTKRASPNMKMALDITRFFGKLAPKDPVRSDFALTRFGIRPELDPAMLPVLRH